MGLDDFTSDDSSPSTSNTSSSTSSNTGGEPQDNSPSPTSQAFSDEKDVTPRRIKYVVKSWGMNWSYTHSMLRFETGEQVMYATEPMKPIRDEVVAVFTTIQPATSQTLPEENLPIWVTLWNFENQDNINEGTYIEPEDDWDKELDSAIKEHIEMLKERTD